MNEIGNVRVERYDGEVSIVFTWENVEIAESNYSHILKRLSESDLSIFMHGKSLYIP